jgi:hypothetical protein
VGDQPGMGGRTVMDNEAMLVKAATRSTAGIDTYMLWRGRLYEIQPSAVSNLAQGAQPTLVSNAFVNGVPKGQRLAPLQIPDMGKPFAKNASWKIGDVISVTSFQEKRYVVVRAQDLAWVNSMQAALLGTLQSGSQTQADLGGFGPIGDLQPPTARTPQDAPIERPTIATYAGTGLCSVLQDDQGTSQLRADVTLDLTKRPGTAKRSAVGGVYADYVIMPPGRGAIVSSGQTYSLVAQDGVRYAAANSQVLEKLGYGGIATVRLPSALITLLPEGPGLDPAKALVPITVS